VTSDARSWWWGTGPICSAHGFRQQSATRTRGQQPWRRVWATHLCVECRKPGSVALSAMTPDGVRLVSAGCVAVWLCQPCLKSVQSVRTFGERREVGFPNVRTGRGLIPPQHWEWLLSAVPEPKKRKKRRRKAAS